MGEPNLMEQQKKNYGTIQIPLEKGGTENWDIVDFQSFEDGDKNITFSNGKATLVVPWPKDSGEEVLAKQLELKANRYYRTITERAEINKKRDGVKEKAKGERLPATKGALKALAQFIANGGIPVEEQAILYEQNREKVSRLIQEIQDKKDIPVREITSEKPEPQILIEQPVVEEVIIEKPYPDKNEEVSIVKKASVEGKTKKTTIENKNKTSDNLNTKESMEKKEVSLGKKDSAGTAKVARQYSAPPKQNGEKKITLQDLQNKKEGVADTDAPETFSWPTNDFKKHTWTKISDLPNGGFLYELNDKEKTRHTVDDPRDFNILRNIIVEKFTLPEKKSQEALVRARKKNGVQETIESEKNQSIQTSEATYERRVGIIDQRIQEILKDKALKKQILGVLNRAKKGELVLATHGTTYTNKITTETGTIPTTDLDGKLTAYIFDQAGIKSKEQQFTEKGATIDEKTKNKADIYFDTGENGKIISIIKDEETGKEHLVFGNHFDGRNTKTSSAAILYSLLNQLDKLPPELKKNKKLKEFIAFNNDTDNLIIPSPILRDYKAGLSQTLYGHYRDLAFTTIKEHFLSGKTALDPLDKKVLEEKIKYKDRTITREEMLLERIRGSEIGVKKAEEEMAKNKMPSETTELGKVLVNDWKESPISMRELAKIRGYDATITLNEKGAFISRPGVNIEDFGKKLQKTFPELKVINSMILFYPTKTTFNRHTFLEALNLTETNKADKKDTKTKENRAILVDRLIQEDLGWSKEMINHLSDEKLQELIRNKEKPSAGNLKWETVRGTTLSSSVTQEEFEEFQKTGKATLGTLEQIALKFSRNQMLDPQEVSILSSYQKQIEGLAKNAEKRLSIDLQIEEIRKRKEVFVHNKEVLLERIRLAKEQLAKLKAVPTEQKIEEAEAGETENEEREHAPGDHEKVALLAERLKRGETLADAESLQLQSNYPKLLEKLLQKNSSEQNDQVPEKEVVSQETIDTNEQQEERKEKDLEIAKRLRLDFIKIQISQNITTEEKLQVVKEFFGKNFGWNILAIELRKEDNGLEMTIDNKKVSLPKNTGLTFMDGKPALTFTMEDIINAKYEVL